MKRSSRRDREQGLLRADARGGDPCSATDLKHDAVSTQSSRRLARAHERASGSFAGTGSRNGVGKPLGTLNAKPVLDEPRLLGRPCPLRLALTAVVGILGRFVLHVAKRVSPRTADGNTQRGGYGVLVSWCLC